MDQIIRNEKLSLSAKHYGFSYTTFEEDISSSSCSFFGGIENRSSMRLNLGSGPGLNLGVPLLTAKLLISAKYNVPIKVH